MLVQYLAGFFKFLMLLHKLWRPTTLLLHEELKIETFMCAAQFLIYLASFCMSLVIIARPRETMDMLNSRPWIWSCLKKLGANVPSPDDNLSKALKLVSVLLVSQCLDLSAAMSTTLLCSAHCQLAISLWQWGWVLSLKGYCHHWHGKCYYFRWSTQPISHRCSPQRSH